MSFTGSLHRMSVAEVWPGRHWIDRLDWLSWALVALTSPTMVCGRLVRRSVLRAHDFGADEMALTVTRHPDAWPVTA